LSRDRELTEGGGKKGGDRLKTKMESQSATKKKQGTGKELIMHHVSRKPGNTTSKPDKDGKRSKGKHRKRKGLLTPWERVKHHSMIFQADEGQQ